MALERLCGVEDLAPGEARRFDVGRLRVALVRVGDDWYAIGDRCTHQDVSLAEGEVHTDTLELECWKHGSCFSLRTGVPSSLPATRPTPTYPVRVEGGDVLIEVEEP
jgi:3-phenylpropionate/trans-cinnamate dioxygenase ferredoxin subunit